jgi:hypothetical protein
VGNLAAHVKLANPVATVLLAILVSARRRVRALGVPVRAYSNPNEEGRALKQSVAWKT